MIIFVCSGARIRCGASRPLPEPHKLSHPRADARMHDPDAGPFWGRPPCGLGSAVTVLLNTSPCASCPSTRLLEEVVASLLVHSPCLAGCSLLLLADGCKLHASKYAWKSGQVTQDKADVYARYLARVQHLCTAPGSALHGAQLVALQEHHGCAHALRRGLARTATRYVLSIQHDRPLCADVDLGRLVAALDADPACNMLLLPTLATLEYAGKASSRSLPGDLFAPVLVGGAVTCTPLAAFLDSTHLGRAQWYRDTVFGNNRLVPLCRGCFLEDSFGQAQLALLRDAARAGIGRETLLRTGCYVVADIPAAVVCHLDGHDQLCSDPGWRKWRHRRWHCDQEELDRLQVCGTLPSALPPDSLVSGFFDGVWAPKRQAGTRPWGAAAAAADVGAVAT